MPNVNWSREDEKWLREMQLSLAPLPAVAWKAESLNRLVNDIANQVKLDNQVTLGNWVTLGNAESVPEDIDTRARQFWLSCCHAGLPRLRKKFRGYKR